MPVRNLASWTVPGALALGVLAAAGCAPAPGWTGASGAGTAAVSVVAAFYPLQFAAERVGAGRVAVESLTQPGTEPHDLELSPQQVADIARADLVLYVKGFQPAIDRAVEMEAGDRALDVSAGLRLLPAGSGIGVGDEPAAVAGDHADEGVDPHVWLDPRNMATIGQHISARLALIDPAGRAAYRRADTGFTAQLRALDTRWLRGTRTCASRFLVVSHAAFAYLAQRYRFTQVAVSGLSPDTEPSPTTIAAIADFVRHNGVTTVYNETLADPAVAQTVADEAGVTTSVLDPIEGVAPGSGDTYFTLMAANLAAVRAGQTCS